MKGAPVMVAEILNLEDRYKLDAHYLCPEFLPEHDAKVRGKKPGYYQKENVANYLIKKNEQGDFVDSHNKLVNGYYKTVVTGVVHNGKLSHIRIYGDLEHSSVNPNSAPEKRPKDKPYIVNHSDFVQGEPVVLPGYMTFRQGKLQRMTNESGHYKVNFYGFMAAAAHVMQEMKLEHLELKDYSQDSELYYTYFMVNENKERPEFSSDDENEKINKENGYHNATPSYVTVIHEENQIATLSDIKERGIPIALHRSSRAFGRVLYSNGYNDDMSQLADSQLYKHGFFAASSRYPLTTIVETPTVAPKDKVELKPKPTKLR